MLQVKEMSPAIKKNLQALYRELREDYPLQIELVQETRRVRGESIGDGDKEIKTGKILRRELNGFSMFFYNAGFDANRYRIGLKYNETWVEEVVAFGHQREHIQFEFFIREEKAILSDWRDGQLMKPLDVISPPIEPRRSSKPLPPVTLRSKVRVFILPESNFKSAFDRSQGIYEGGYPTDDRQVVELYHLESIIGQRHNVATERPELVTQLQGLHKDLRQGGVINYDKDARHS